jgi:hypothetical protein
MAQCLSLRRLFSREAIEHCNADGSTPCQRPLDVPIASRFFPKRGVSWKWAERVVRRRSPAPTNAPTRATKPKQL